jgi:DNA mismatch repair protein MutL
MSAYQDLIPSDSFPLYILFIDLDPQQVDVNVHPTKQEIKFEDEKIVYAFVQAAVKHALAQFSITPTLDFDLDPSIQHLEAVSRPVTDEQKASIASSSLYQGFTQKHQAHLIESKNSGLKDWSHVVSQEFVNRDTTNHFEFEQPVVTNLCLKDNCPLIQLFNTYVVAPTNRGFVLVHQQLAHERVLYEKLLAASNGKPVAYQRTLFPVTLELSTQDAVLLDELLGDLLQLGYLVEPFGKDSFVIQGTPADLDTGNERNVLENLLEQFKHFSSDVKFSKREKLVRSLAQQQAVKPGNSLTDREMASLVQDLFACLQPGLTASGNPTYIEFKKDYMEQLFKR